MHHLFLSYQPSHTALSNEKRVLESWANGAEVEYTILEERLVNKRVSEPAINKLFNNVVNGDVVVATSLTRMGRSIKMLLSVMETLYTKGVTIYTIDDDKTYAPDRDTKSFIASMRKFSQLVTDIKAERGNESLVPLKESGQKLGRPLGAKKSPEKNALYGKIERLEELIAEGKSLNSIAMELGVSRGTIFNYIKANSKVK